MTDLDEFEDVATADDGREECPICGFRAKNLGAHMKKHENQANGSSAGGGRQRTARLDRPASVNLREEEEKLVQSLAMVGMFITPLIPHTGLTIISRAPDREIAVPNAKPVIKRGIASILIDYGKCDTRVMKAIVRFNMIMQGGDALELVASIGAAVAVDVRLVSPDLALPVPGVPEEALPRPIHMLIGDVVEQVREARGEVPQHEGAEEHVEAGAEA